MANLKIVIDALINASDDLTKTKGQVEALGTAAQTASTKAGTGKSKWDSLMTSFTGINNAIGIAKEAFQVLSGVYNTVVGDTVSYAKQVRDLSREIGASAEDTSKLIQAADDVGISFGTLESAMTIAIRNGVNPTIDGMGKLADEYLAIQDPIDRTKFLLDNFGRSGADLAPLMELGSAGIKALGEEAEATGLVLSGQAVADAREYEIAIDSLSDAWQGFVTVVGTKVIPVVTSIMNQITQSSSISDLREQVGDLASGMEQAGLITKDQYTAIMKDAYDRTKTTDEATADLTATLSDLEGQAGIAEDGMVTYTDAIAAGKAQLALMAGQAEDTAGAVDELTEAQKKMIAEHEKITTLDNNYKGIIDLAYKYTDILDEIAANEETIRELQADGAEDHAEEIDGLIAKNEELKGSMTDLANQVTLDMFQATIAIGGVTEAELAAYMQMAIDMGLMSEEGAQAAITAYSNAIETINGYEIDEKTGNVSIDAVAAFVTLDLLQQYQLLDKEQRVFVKTYYGTSGGYDPYENYTGTGEAVGGSVNAGNPYTWQEYGYRGEVFVPSADGFVLSRADAERALARALYGGGSAVDPEAIGKAVAQAMSGITSSKKGGNVYNLTMPTSSNPADIRTAFELMEAWA